MISRMFGEILLLTEGYGVTDERSLFFLDTNVFLTN